MKTLLTITLCLISLGLFAQGTSINPTGAAPDPSAGLDVDFTDKGFLMPRLTTVQRDGVGSPAEGLMIFNTDTKCFEAYVNSTWSTVSCPCPFIAAPATGSHTATATQVDWNWSSVSGASGYKYGTTNNFASATDNGNSTTFSQTGLTCNTTYTLYVWAYDNCGNSNALTLTETTAACWTCGDNFTVTHTAGSVAPETKTVTYSTVLTSLSGSSKCWLKQNLGADQTPTSVTDATESSAGWYWQWDRIRGYKHDGTTRTPNTLWPYPISETGNWDTANDPCIQLLGNGWRLPTSAELTNVNSGWTNYNNGYNSDLKLHTAGYLKGNDSGNLYQRGDFGGFWSSSDYSSTDGDALYITSSSSIINHGGANKAYGFTVRCIKD